MPEFASNAVFIAPAEEPYLGEATKVAMTADQRANGFIPEKPIAAEHINHELNALTTRATTVEADVEAAEAQITRVRELTLERALLRLHALDVTVDDTAESLGVVSAGVPIIEPFSPAVVVKVNSTGVVLAYDSPDIDLGGVVASITSLVADAASNGTRIAAIGVGGNLATYSDNDGGSWSAGGNGIGGAVNRLVYNPFVNRFHSSGPGTGAVYTSPDIATNWTSEGAGFSQPFSIAVLGSGSADPGRLVVLGNSGDAPRFSYSIASSGGAAFITTSTVPPANAADADEPGDLAGCPIIARAALGSAVYHVMRCDSGARIRTNRSNNGLTWTAGPVLLAPAGTVFNSRPRLLACQTTGMFVIVAPLDNGGTALYSSRDFTAWSGPAVVRSLPIAAFGLASGRLFATHNGVIYASDSARY
jgi:hypothetical protein